MKMIATLFVAFCSALVFGGGTYWWLNRRSVSLPFLSSGSSLTLDQALSSLGLIVSILSFIATIILTVVGLYIANKSLEVANVALSETRASGPITESILTRSRDALEASVISLKRQSEILDESKGALDTSNTTAAEQRVLLEKSLSTLTEQLGIAVKERNNKLLADRNKLKNTIAKIESVFPMMDITLYQWNRESRVKWLTDVIYLFELEMYNSALLNDNKANEYWQRSLDKMRYQLNTNDGGFLSRSITSISTNEDGRPVMIQGPSDTKPFKILFQKCALEVKRDVYFVSYDIVKKDHETAKAIYEDLDNRANQIRLNDD